MTPRLSLEAGDGALGADEMACLVGKYTLSRRLD